MKRFDIACPCGHGFSMYAREGALIACPYCGKETVLPFSDANGDKKSLEEASSEIISEGGVYFSGAR
ncbi:MAG: hypothetical protein R6U38_04950 [Desulfatiglandaceae bacterium]